MPRQASQLEIAREILYATMAIALAVVVAAAAERVIGFHDLSLVFIATVLAMAAQTRMAVAIYCAALGFVAYDFFFVLPRISLVIPAGPGIATFALFLVAALICGHLAQRLRGQLRALRASQERGDKLHLEAEIERLRASLLASVSHDLRTPLSTIIGAAESLSAYQDQLAPTDQRALADEIAKEGKRLDRHIQNLLDMTRLGQGAPVAERQWIGLDELFGTALSRIEALHPGVVFVRRVPEPPPLVRLHPALMSQALFNVLDNAAKAAPEGSDVVVEGRYDRGALEISVHDEGPGIPPEERERVFEMFHTVSVDDRRSGTGLGLAICRGIVRAHGGSIRALGGAGGRGTTIRIALPLSDEPPVLREGDE